MGEVDIGDAATAGLRMMGRQPFSVLCWGLIMAIYVGLLFLLFGGAVAAAVTNLVANAGSTPSPEQILGLLFSTLGFFFFLFVGAELLAIVFRGAAIRAELDPAASSFAYMRLGAQEAWLLAASFVFWLVLFGANMLMAIPVAALGVAQGVGSIAANVQGGAQHAGVFSGLGLLQVLLRLVIYAVSVWLWLRLCLGVVMSFQDRQFRLFEAWAVSRGHVLRMFLTMLLVVLMMFGVGIVMTIIALVTMAVTLGGVFQDPKAFFSQPPSAWLSAVTPLIVVTLVWIVVGVGVGNALTWGALARLWRQLHPEADVAKTFA